MSNFIVFGTLFSKLLQMSQKEQVLFFSVILILVVFLLLTGLTEAKSFLGPFFTAVVLSMLVLPLARKLEGKFLNRSITSILCTTMLFLFSTAFLALVSFQLKRIITDWETIKEKMKPEIDQFITYISEHVPLEKNTILRNQPDNLLPPQFFSEPFGQTLSYLGTTLGLFGTLILVFVYVFFLLNYRSHFKKFILKLVPAERKMKAARVFEKSADVVQEYLIGRLILMGLLAVMYSIGLGLSGVQNFIVISIIAALLTIIPWIGNILGMALAMIFGYLTTADVGVLIGIIITFSISQFFESYVLQPYIVGDKVGVHPLMVILSVILGGMMWGMIGMVLAIPMVAIITIVFLNISPLNAIGFLLSKGADKK